ncbi:CLUMA_CG007133, isoform A [Clunio marinus]|uniref:CLUMA_CG007133, isoform A n=1 Tax=Clunio marinus TaxID=568069 RepID=A0A1J1HZS2_9DIPT|nr:CLUMA_CG007133, isoform A [Clunio marinus]
MTIKIFSVVFLLAITLRQSQSREVCVPLPDCSLVLCEGPPENCEPINVPGQCCPDISHCKRCLVDGTYYEDGEEVPQTNPCQFCTCYNSELVCAIIDCARPPPGCEGVIVPGQCCRDYSNCGLNCAAVSCLAPPVGCEPIEVPGQCCPDISQCK